MADVDGRINEVNGFLQPIDGKTNAPFLNSKTTLMQTTFTPAAGSANVCLVSITPKDAQGNADLTGIPFTWWLSDSATGFGLTGTTASGAVGAGASGGADFGTLTTKKAGISQPNASGTYILSITDTAKTGFYVCMQNPFTGQVSVSSQLVTGNYG